MSQPVLECVNPWETACLCGARHMPCWPRPDTSCCDRLEPENPTPEQTARIERMLHVATEIIWRLSGKQFGACPVTVRPCRQACADRPSYGYWSGMLWTPVLDAGTWFNLKCDTCFGNASGCSCSELCELDLPGLVAEILEVKQDGLVLEPEMYRVDNFRKLVRLPTARHRTGVFFNGSPDIPNSVYVTTPDGDTMQVGGNDSDISPGGGTFTLLSNAPFAVVFGRGRRKPRITMRLCAGAVMTWDVAAVSVTPDIPLAAQTLNSLTVGAAETSVTIEFPSAPTPNSTMTPVFTITGADGCGHMDIGAASYLFEDDSVCWPKCQDLAKPDTEVGTFSVRYRKGSPVPQGGLWAAGLLACELLKACDADKECALPANAQRIARQGVTVELTPVLVKAGSFATGIPEVDLWLQAVNPYQAKAPSRVYSVDRPKPRVQTWPCND